jgi:HlyD family secretion protein
MKKRTKIILIAVTLFIVLGIVAKKAGWIGKSTAMEVSAEKPALRTIVETVSANGKIQPEVEVKISADVSGEIVELHVKEGQKVEAGDHLLTINPDLIKSAADRVAASLNQAKANVATTKARQAQVEASFVNTELSYNRTKGLHDKKAVSDAEFDAAKAQFEAAKADLEAARQTVLAAEYSVKSAEATLKEANDNLARTRIYAPTAGTVSKLNVELGERVVGTAQMSGTELLRIANLNEMEVSVDVNENDIVRIHLYDTTNVEVDAYGDRKFTGIVTEIANSANTNTLGNNADQVTNFSVKIRILRSSYLDLVDEKQEHLSPFRPGMSATVDIRTNVKKNILSLPIMAVSTRTASEISGKTNNDKDEKAASKDDAENENADEEIKEVIFIMKDGKALIREVTTGIQDNTYIEITSGLQADSSMVITGPYSAVSKLLKNESEVQLKLTEDQN